MSGIILDKLLQGANVEWKHLWEVTTWDKRFNAVEKHKQIHFIKYIYLLASELKKLIDMNGDVKLLTTNETNYWTTSEKAGKAISEGEIVCIPWGGDLTIQYYKGKFVTSDNRIAVSNNTNILNTKYLYYYLKEKYDLIKSFYRGSGIKHPNMAAVLDIQIPIPPLEVQKEIVRILDKFTALTAELSMRQKQYNHYRDSLLTFRDGEVEWKPLGEVANFKNGKGHEKDISHNGNDLAPNLSPFIS